MLQVTLFTMAGPAIMPFYVNRFKSEIGFFVKKSGILFLGHIAQPYLLAGGVSSLTLSTAFPTRG